MIRNTDINQESLDLPVVAEISFADVAEELLGYSQLGDVLWFLLDLSKTTLAHTIQSA